MTFDEFFLGVYGARWSSLRASLVKDSPKVLLENPFALENYALDPASTEAARALGVAAGDHVADFCSAPGGKLLTLMFDAARAGIFDQVKFIANDLSPARVARLKAVLHDCLPPEILAKIEVRKSDASRWGVRARADGTQFDKILLDAPCSGEGHLLRSPQELARWSVKGMKRLAVRQHSLLCSALDCLKPGGRLVYSTCTISPLENDGVIERLQESRANQFSIVTESAVGEATRFGRMILPDSHEGGPIFFSVLEKV